MTDHIHWAGPGDTTVNYYGQDLTITTNEVPEDPIGTLRIKAAGFVGAGVVLPNSTEASPTVTAIPGTNPTLNVRADGSWPIGYVQVEPAAGPFNPNSQDAAVLTSGILSYQRLAGTVPESGTVILYDRPSLVSPGTAADSWQWRYNGIRTVYGNEYNLFRVRGIPDVQVPARIMSNAAHDNTTQPTFQVSLSDAATHWFQVLANGDILAGALSILPDTPQAVTFIGNMGNAALINDGNVVNTGAPYVARTVYVASQNRVWMDGNIANNGGVSIPAQTALFTVAAAHRPGAWVQFTARTSTNLAVRLTVKGSTGVVVADQAMAAGATLNLDGFNWRKA